MRRRDRNPVQRLRLAVESLPLATREAMVRGIDANPIIVGAYVDRDSGGICPMLAAHRNGGRTSLASFARAWDRYTGARRPRLASRREVRTLRALLVASLGRDLAGPQPGSIAEAAARIRAERAALASRDAASEARERNRTDDLRARLRWRMRPAKRHEEYKDLVAAAEEELAELRAAGVLDDEQGAGSEETERPATAPAPAG
jgi:hypothetical protein